MNLDAVGKMTVLALNKAPFAVDGMNQGRQIRIGELNGANAQARGQELVRLLQRHEPVKQALKITLAQPPASPPQPVYFRVVSPQADALPWECLYDPKQGFVALDRRWPLARIGTLVYDVKERSYRPPLNVLAVLSAAQRDALPQLDALISAVRKARKEGLDVHLHVISGQQTVLERIAKNPAPYLSGQRLETTPAALAAQIGDAEPDIVHVLCHGTYSGTVPGLAFATKQDLTGDEPVGTVVLATENLAGVLQPHDPWLVVLAACETAQSGDGAGFAHKLVDAGLPAVIGMRRLVNLGAMNTFTAAVYPEIFSLVNSAVGGNGNPGLPRVIEWSCALTAPRQAATVGVDPIVVDAWSDPVLYSQQDDLKVLVEPIDPVAADQQGQLRAALDTWSEYRQTLDPVTTPPDLLTEADETIARLRTLVEASRG
ncbi:CHAT domain-containing protein [Agromyces sp. NPDC058126]|uniref:CHAT domain-containing protein n=1 Tax=Agromyces sp. NPDC058126 TaxID=3346350 RepID=UPI0036DA57F7